MENQILNAILLIFSFFFGTAVGSFLNVCVYRLPREMSVVKPRSRCPKCEETIQWYDNIPILSYLVLGAKCRHCRTVISWQYPLVEGLTGALFLLVYWRFGISLATPVYLLLTSGLVLVTFVDLDDWTIPNEVTYPGIPIGLCCSAIAMFYPESGLAIPGMYETVFDALIGVIVGGGSLYVLDKLTLILFKKRGMGFGDVKLLAMLGAFFGWKGVIMIILLASIVGSIVGITMITISKKKTTIEEGGEETTGHYLPFGPYLAVAGLLVMFFGGQVYNYYMDAFAVVP